MAFTATLIRQSIMSNQKVAEYNVTADAASGSVSTPLGFIESVQVSPISMTTAAGKFKANTTVASAVANGVVFVSSVASGDNFYMTVYGRP